LFSDLRPAVRTFLQKPGFALIAVFTMALGIGATTAIFSVADAILWKSLPLSEPSRLVMVLERRIEQQTGWIPVSPANFVDWKERSRSFEHLAAYQYSTANLAGSEGFEPERMATCLTGEDFFRVVGAEPELGRVFTPAESQMGADREVILSHNFWVRRFAADRGIVGQTVQIDGRAVSVVGVMPAGFDFPAVMDAWMPLALTPAVWQLRPAPILFSVARLKPGVPLDEARAEMDNISRRLGEQFPKTNKGWGTTVMPFREFLMGGLLPQYTWLLLGVTGFVLLIACANVANLQLARASGRVREMAVRTALGATRGRLVRQLLGESLVLSCAGAVVGVLFALWGVDLVRWGISAQFVQDIPNWNRISVDARALWFTVAVALASGVLAGLVPAFQAARRGGTSLNETLKEGGRSASAGRGRLHVRNVLVAADVALALVLLVGAGLMIKGLERLAGREQNLHPDTLLTLRMNLPETQYDNGRKMRQFHDQLLARVQSLPGVASAVIANSIPHSGTLSAIRSFTTPQLSPHDIGEDARCQYQSVSPAYFRTLHIALRAGREFAATDVETAPRVAIISRRLAERFWPHGDAIGKRVAIGHENSFGPWLTIVGVAADTVQNAFDREPRFTVYVPYAQEPTPDVHLAVRAYGDPSVLVRAVENEIHGLDRELPVDHVETLTRLLSDEMTAFRYIAVVMSFFGALALLLASVGVYGVMSCSVSERTQEIGLRVAMGARGRDVLALVLRRTLAITLAGIAAGLAAAFALARVLAGLVFGVSATDATTFASGALLLMAVALLASYIPARRAARVDPINALRYE
jgi:putative ABC transport system permease protein